VRDHAILHKGSLKNQIMSYTSSDSPSKAVSSHTSTFKGLNPHHQQNLEDTDPDLEDTLAGQGRTRCPHNTCSACSGIMWAAAVSIYYHHQHIYTTSSLSKRTHTHITRKP